MKHFITVISCTLCILFLPSCIYIKTTMPIQVKEWNRSSNKKTNDYLQIETFIQNNTVHSSLGIVVYH